jgi:cytochrome c5
MGRIFTPFDEEPVIYTPMAAVNWPPSAYDPNSQWLYICANENANGARMDATQFEQPTFEASFRGGGYVGAGVPSSGVYSALDVKTNRLVWQRRFNDGCRSGSLVTAGGLIFIGRNDGRLTALDTRDGKRLWEFQTEAPVNTSVSTFMHNGQQYFVTYAGGGWFSAVKGDGIWVFSLEGTLDEFDPVSQANAVTLSLMPGPDRVADISNGESIYKAACVYCHGDNGEGGEGGGKSIAASLGVAGIFNVLNNGRNQMPAFGVSMTPEQMHDLATYVLRLRESQQ